MSIVRTNKFQAKPDCMDELVAAFKVIGDKAYDSSTLRQTAATKGINTCIPGRSNRTMTVPFSATVYRRRHRVENFFRKNQALSACGHSL